MNHPSIKQTNIFKIKKWDTIWLVTTAKNSYTFDEKFDTCLKYLQDAMWVTFLKWEEFGTGVVWIDPKRRVKDINRRIRDPSISTIRAVSGWHFSNELLPYIDREALEKHPTALIWYSDITCLLVAWYAHWAPAILWPTISTCTRTNTPGYEQTIQRLQEHISSTKKDILLEDVPDYFDYTVWAERYCYDWWIRVIKEGTASWKLFGGNLSTLLLTAWTNYALKNISWHILCIEECIEMSASEIRRMLFQLRMQPWGDEITGVICGKRNRWSEWWKDIPLKQTLLDVFWDLNIPIVTWACFGHIMPMQTLQFWSRVSINTLTKTYIMQRI